MNLEQPEGIDPEIAVKLLQPGNSITNSAVRTADTPDMLEKGRIRVPHRSGL